MHMRYIRSLCVCLLLVLIISGANVFAAATEYVNIAFRIPLTMSIELDKYNIDAGNANLYDELWAPIGDGSSYKVYVQNNSGSNWEFSVKMPDDLRRAEGVSDLTKDVIKASDIFWTVVYAGYWDGTAQQEKKSPGEALTGMKTTILGSGRTDPDGKSLAGFPFVAGVDAPIFAASDFYSGTPNDGKSYKFQFAFKFIIKPPVNTTAGDYNGNIVFTMRNQ